MYKISFYVPQQAVDHVKAALFAAGAGHVGHYTHCAWQTVGQGQFMPLSNSNPTIGTHNQLTYVEEYKVEMVCEEQYIVAAVAALKQAHPYEMPGYDVIRCDDF